MILIFKLTNFDLNNHLVSADLNEDLPDLTQLENLFITHPATSTLPQISVLALQYIKLHCQNFDSVRSSQHSK